MEGKAAFSGRDKFHFSLFFVPRLPWIIVFYYIDTDIYPPWNNFSSYCNFLSKKCPIPVENPSFSATTVPSPSLSLLMGLFSHLIILAVGFYGGSHMAKNYEVPLPLILDKKVSIDPQNEGRFYEEWVPKEDWRIPKRLQEAGRSGRRPKPSLWLFSWISIDLREKNGIFVDFNEQWK